ncbi:Fur family transcriptional regulator [Arsenicicoccus sp. oral taxon 190]|uniref:Fur family transcriptional regulator n=1 Tax=Arsenicicoccus sp. oral taxon 190 TaxID=1658671 RepID=UPI00067A0BE0|nr:Fur family transcriptional regulator [Arsenicicoccus sp. oral taxon 190]AKT50300.1 hypothetical protein ADJ73_01315 [Arsenicicoccus sp. oral taxon 190]
MGQDVDAIFRNHGLRVTSQRRRVVAALGRLQHATPDQLSREVDGDGGDALPLSTIYRNLDTLTELGVVAATRLTEGPPTYHLVDHATHLHLVCNGCGAITEAPLAVADELVETLYDRDGFVADLRHLPVRGWCARCAPERSQEDRHHDHPRHPHQH